jgi:hypothetical protein
MQTVLREITRFQEDEGAEVVADVSAGLDDLGVDDQVTEILAFILIGLSSVFGANTALGYWTGGTLGMNLTKFSGIGNLVGLIVYTAGSLTEMVLWVFALLESELTGFDTELTPFFNWWAPIVEWIALFGYGGVMVLYLISLIIDGEYAVGVVTFFNSAVWWAAHTAAHMFFVVKAVNWAGGSGEVDFDAMPETDSLATQFEF